MKAIRDRKVVLTGGTGFLGHYILAELLASGFRCFVLLRAPFDPSVCRLTRLLAELGIDAQALIAEGTIEPIAASLPDMLPALAVPPSTILIHAAAATTFNRNTNGEPERTNVGGTRAVLDWVERMGIRQVHLVSSAYTCGKTSEPVTEAFNPHPAAFHNDYERSKWESERLGVDWALRTGGDLAIHRPSIIVGASDTGRATKYGGIYLSARATELLDRMHHDHSQSHRQAIPLRIIGRPLDRQNIVPVDYVAKMIVASIATPGACGTVYNLVHPDPPSNLCIKQALELYFNIGGGRFVPPERLAYSELNDLERGFYDVVNPIRHYFVDTPNFRRTNTASLEMSVGITCPRYDALSIGRLIRYAQSTSWGRRDRRMDDSAPGCAEYFERFLPFHVARSEVAKMTALTAAVSFIIEEEREGRWVCMFDRGRLTNVHRGLNGHSEDFGYRTTRAVFWESISGRCHPQELFLTGRADMFGNIEKALKMSMVLYSFTKEHPCDPKALARFVEESCKRS